MKSQRGAACQMMSGFFYWRIWMTPTEHRSSPLTGVELTAEIEKMNPEEVRKVLTKAIYLLQSKAQDEQQPFR
jgi:hypothetical protein